MKLKRSLVLLTISVAALFGITRLVIIPSGFTAYEAAVLRSEGRD